jgi:hypothetical protein
MLVTDQFIFLHLPRAGGTFVYESAVRLRPQPQGVSAYSAIHEESTAPPKEVIREICL